MSKAYDPNVWRRYGWEDNTAVREGGVPPLIAVGQVWHFPKADIDATVVFRRGEAYLLAGPGMYVTDLLTEESLPTNTADEYNEVPPYDHDEEAYLVAGPGAPWRPQYKDMAPGMRTVAGCESTPHHNPTHGIRSLPNKDKAVNALYLAPCCGLGTIQALRLSVTSSNHPMKSLDGASFTVPGRTEVRGSIIFAKLEPVQDMRKRFDVQLRFLKIEGLEFLDPPDLPVVGEVYEFVAERVINHDDLGSGYADLIGAIPPRPEVVACLDRIIYHAKRVGALAPNEVFGFAPPSEINLQFERTTLMRLLGLNESG